MRYRAAKVMCGIAGAVGIVERDRSQSVFAMREGLLHRGPDSAGMYSDAHASLGIRRLKIIDLTTGDQPQSNEDGTVWTVFNGEIYNFQELRQRLIAEGHQFRTASDTEVIVHLYEQDAHRFPERLIGMFAIALWDSRARRLVLVRDRLGKKPLIYREGDGEIHFASEHAALLAGLRERPSVDPSSIRAYLRLGYVPGARDAFAGLRKVPPGHLVTWHQGRVEVRRYWCPPAAGQVNISEADAVSEFRRLFDRAVERRLIADVPIGAFLSGGVDSSAVVATMARLAKVVRTFSVGFEDANFSELPHARRIAELFGTEHHEFVVRPMDVDVVPELVRHYGQPYADSSAVPTYYLAQMTRRSVTVSLNGDGGDELFAGYDRHLAARLAAFFDGTRGRVLRAPVRAVARLLPDSLSPLDPFRRARRFLQATELEPRNRYMRWLGLFDPHELTEVLDPDFRKATDHTEAEPPFVGNEDFASDPVAAAQSIDLELYLPDDLLVKMDIASMANSLEVRSPFLDHELVEFAITLPTHLKLRGRHRKYLVKRAFEDTLPRENLHRRKQGFAMPVGKWFRGDLKGFAMETILSSRALSRGYFEKGPLTRLVDDHLTGRADHTHKIWALMMLELWHVQFLDD